MLLSFAIAAIAISVVPIGIASAQATQAAEAPTLSTQERARVRREFEAGVAAVRDENWSLAYERFVSVYQRYPTNSVLINLALAERHTGRLLESRESYRSFLARAESARDASLVPDVERVLQELEREIPRVRVVAWGIASGDEIRVDGRTLEAPTESLQLNPGRHEFSIQREGRTVSTVFVSLSSGSDGAVEMRAPSNSDTAPSSQEVNIAGVDSHASDQPRLFALSPEEVEAERRELASISMSTRLPAGATGASTNIPAQAVDARRDFISRDDTGLHVGIALGVVGVAAVAVLIAVIASTPGSEVSSYRGNLSPFAVNLP